MSTQRPPRDREPEREPRRPMYERDRDGYRERDRVDREPFPREREGRGDRGGFAPRDMPMHEAIVSDMMPDATELDFKKFFKAENIVVSVGRREAALW